MQRLSFVPLAARFSDDGTASFRSRRRAFSSPAMRQRLRWKGLRVDGKDLIFGGVAPRFLRDEARNSSERVTQYFLRGARCRQVNADHRLHLDDARSDFDEAQAQPVELRDTPDRSLRHGDAQAPHQPIGAGVQEQPQLVGAGLRA